MEERRAKQIGGGTLRDEGGGAKGGGGRGCVSVPKEEMCGTILISQGMEESEFHHVTPRRLQKDGKDVKRVGRRVSGV
jgi:hypothetical protein